MRQSAHIFLSATFAILFAGMTSGWADSGAEIVPQIGHTADVQSVAFSPDGRFILSGSSDATIILWETATGRMLRTITGQGAPVRAVAFSPDGRTALSGGGGGTLKLWDILTGKELRSFGGGWLDSITQSFFSPATGNDRIIGVTSVAVSRDGRYALSGHCDRKEFMHCSKGSMKLWEISTGTNVYTFTEPYHAAMSVAFSPDGRLALSSAPSLWDTTSGKQLRKFNYESAAALAFSADGRFALTGSNSSLGTLMLWDMPSANKIREFAAGSPIITVALSPDGRFALSGTRNYDYKAKLWDVATGRLVREFTARSWNNSVTFSPDGRYVLAGNQDSSLTLWQTDTGQEVRRFGGQRLGWGASGVLSAVFSSDGKLILAGSHDGHARLWEVATGRQLRSFSDGTAPVHSVALSPDDRTAFSNAHAEYKDSTITAWETGTGKTIRKFVVPTGNGKPWFAVSADGRYVLSQGSDIGMAMRDLTTGSGVPKFAPQGYGGTNLAVFSQDGRFVLSSWVSDLRLRDANTGKLLHQFKGHSNSILSIALSRDGRFALSGDYNGSMRSWDTSTGKEVRSFGGNRGPVYAVAISANGRWALSGNCADNALSGSCIKGTMKLWDMASGKELRTFELPVSVNSVAFSPDGRLALSSNGDGAIRLWNIESGQELARLFGNVDGTWFAITSHGFFSSMSRDTAMLSIVRGLEVTTIGQIHQSLFNPDLVREALAGDPRGEVKRAAAVINLDRVLDSGPPPAVQIISTIKGDKSQEDLVTVRARIEDRGKGIGRIEWRVNGVTAGVSIAPSNAGATFEAVQQLALDQGENMIEVVAYEARNILASLPAQTSVSFVPPTGTTKPKLHVLAIGINKYIDKGWTPPGGSQREHFAPLELAVGDAKALGAALQKAGANLYGEVRVRTVLDQEATLARIDALVKQMAAEIKPRDTFVLFAAAHGYSSGGRFYLIPQDYQGGSNPDALAQYAIDQLKLQDWLANRIKAKKALILLDTCESGALTNGYAQSRLDRPAAESSIGRLHEATGRPVLTAAAEGQYAHEGLIAAGERRGIFTWAILDALQKGDTNGDGMIQLSELVSHVQNAVPGIAKGMARAVARAQPTLGVQTPRFGSLGEDFAVAGRLR